MESKRRNLFGEQEDVIGECKANICMEGEKPKTHLENEHMNNLKIHEKRKVKKLKKVLGE